MGRSGRGAILLAGIVSVTACGRQEAHNMTAQEVAAELRKVHIEPGLWEVTSRVLDASGPNLPREARARMIAHRQSVRNCVTPERAAHPEGNFLRTQRDSNCTYRDFSTDGGQVRGSMRCTGGGMPGVMTTRMEGRYGPQSYDVTLHMSSTEMPHGADVTIIARTIARRISDCPANGTPPARPALEPRQGSGPR
jgi:hypothetical protein